MVKNLIIGAVVALAVTVYALIECVRTRPQEVRSLSKPSWLVVIVLLPLVGAILWFWLGRPRYDSTGRPRQETPRPARPAAPDDDAAFLRNLETQRRLEAKKEELRRREAELKALEEKFKDPASGPGNPPPTPGPRPGSPEPGASEDPGTRSPDPDAPLPDAPKPENPKD